MSNDICYFCKIGNTCEPFDSCGKCDKTACDQCGRYDSRRDFYYKTCYIMVKTIRHKLDDDRKLLECVVR